MADEKKANPGYRAFLANGSNVTRTLVLVLWEIVLELIAAARQRRRDVQPRGHRGGIYPLLRAGMCVFVRDLVVFSVLQDMFAGCRRCTRPSPATTRSPTTRASSAPTRSRRCASSTSASG